MSSALSTIVFIPSNGGKEFINCLVYSRRPAAFALHLVWVNVIVWPFDGRILTPFLFF